MKQFDIVVRKFYALSVIAHVAHINTRSFSEHSALGDFYEKVSDFKDRLIEYLVGEGRIAKVEAAVLECGGDVIKEADALAKLFCDQAKAADDEALINMSGEFEESVGKLKYLFLLK